MATIQLYRSNVSMFGAALVAMANAVPSPPTLATANTTLASNAAVYAADASGSYYLILGYALVYSPTTGRLTGGVVDSIEYHGAGAASGSFAVFGNVGTLVSSLIALSAQADPAAVLYSKTSNTFISDTADLVAPGSFNTVQVGGTVNSRIDAGPGSSTAVLSAFRGDATLSGGGGTESVTVASITTQLVSTEQVRFLDGSLIESQSTQQGQAILAFKGIFGRLPDAINAGGYAQAASSFVYNAVTQMLGTAEAQASLSGLDNGQFITRIYGNVLGRAPSDAELSTMRAMLDAGRQNRAGLVVSVVSSPEAATSAATTSVFAGSGVFAASPGAVDVLRAYEVLLGRLPDATSLAVNGAALDAYYSFAFSYGTTTKSLPDFYRQIQSSVEFASRTTPNPYGITPGSSFGTVYAATHGDALTATNLGLITSTGGVPHLPG